MDEVRIAVIGAGLAGLACARELARADVSVTVFEKARGLGGRLATRREGNLAFDHGAQFFTARSESFRRFTDAGRRTGVIAPWQPRIREDRRELDAPIDEWLVGTPGMSAAVRPLSRNLDVRTSVCVHELIAGQRGWQVLTDAGTPDELFDALAVAVPAPQALDLLGPHGGGFRRISEVRMTPCWTLMISFATPLEGLPGVLRWTSGPLAWAACDTSKPGRPEHAQCWVVHASAAWSGDHIRAEAVDVAQWLWEEFGRAAGIRDVSPVHLRAHRWHHAFTERPLGQPCIVDQECAAGACGDWCIAPRVEAAWDSGRTLAHALLSIVGRSAPAMLR